MKPTSSILIVHYTDAGQDRAEVANGLFILDILQQLGQSLLSLLTEGNKDLDQSVSSCFLPLFARGEDYCEIKPRANPNLPRTKSSSP